MATSDTAVEALLEKAGIIRVQGGLDQCGLCMEVPLLRDRTRAELARILPPESATFNSVDALPSRTPEQIEAVIRVLRELEGDHIDVIAVLTGDSGLSDNAGIYQKISDAMQSGPIPVVPVISSVTSCRPKIADFIAQGNVYFPDEVELGQTLGQVARWPIPQKDSQEPDGYDRGAIRDALSGCSGTLAPETVGRVLKAVGFRLPRQIEVFQKDRLAESCRQAGHPLAMKVIGPLHKTDVGGVRLGIRDDAQALAAWKDLMQIAEACGVLIQPMIGGLEVIMGASREEEFGRLVVDFPQIREIDLNPVKGVEADLYAVDARIIV